MENLTFSLLYSSFQTNRAANINTRQYRTVYAQYGVLKERGACSAGVQLPFCVTHHIPASTLCSTHRARKPWKVSSNLIMIWFFFCECDWSLVILINSLNLLVPDWHHTLRFNVLQTQSLDAHWFLNDRAQCSAMKDPFPQLGGRMLLFNKFVKYNSKFRSFRRFWVLNCTLLSLFTVLWFLKPVSLKYIFTDKSYT